MRVLDWMLFCGAVVAAFLAFAVARRDGDYTAFYLAMCWVGAETRVTFRELWR